MRHMIASKWNVIYVADEKLDRAQFTIHSDSQPATGGINFELSQFKFVIV